MGKSFIEVITAAFGGILTYIYGMNWQLILIWILLLFLDIVTGVIKACKKGEFSSHDMKVGLYKKAGEFFLMFALMLGQQAASINGINLPIANLFVFAFIFKELGSIIENSIGMGIKIPEIILKWFKVVKDQIDKTDVGTDSKTENEQSK